MTDPQYDDAAWYVYLLERQPEPPNPFVEGDQPKQLPTRGQGVRHYYVGMTNNLKGRLYHHNSGQVRATKGQFWQIVAYATLDKRAEAACLEAWLKNGDTRRKREDFRLWLSPRCVSRTSHSKDLLGKAQLWKAQRDLRRNFGLNRKGVPHNAVQST